MAAPLVLLDAGESVAFAFDDMLRYHGPGSPGGVAHAFKVLERALPRLGSSGPPDRRDITVRTAFGGPGARDGFELVTRAVSEGRYVVDDALRRPQRGMALERFVFRLDAGQQSVTAILREGFVTDEFILLARRSPRSPADERRLRRLKREMSRLVMSVPAACVYDLEPAADRHAR